MTIDYSRAGAVATFAENIRKGITSRDCRFLWREGWQVPNSTGPSEDITDDVLAAAGPETPEETALRSAEDERRFPDRLGDEIAEDMLGNWCNSYKRSYLGRKFDLEDGDEFGPVIFVRDDGVEFEIDIEVHVDRVAL